MCKIVFVAVMLALAGFSYIWFQTDLGGQTTSETKFKTNAAMIVGQAKKAAVNILAEIQTMGVHVTCSAIEEDVQWPFYTWRYGFEQYNHDLMNQSAIELIALTPIVYEEQKSAWELYSMKHGSWIQDSLLSFWKSQLEHNKDKDDATTITKMITPLSFGIPEEIFRWNHGQQLREYTTGPFLPLWQYSSVHTKDTSNINFNLLSNPRIARDFHLASDNRHAVMSEPLNVLELFGPIAKNYQPPNDGPSSVVIQPIFSDFSSQGQVVGAVIASFSWSLLLQMASSVTSDGAVCVFKSSCGRSFTFEIDGGGVQYLGAGDLHDDKYDLFQYASDFGPFFDYKDVSHAFQTHTACQYRLHLYPSDKLLNEYTGRRLSVPGLCISMTFVILSIFIFFHTSVVQLVERNIERNTAKTQALVASYFPENIQQKLLHDTINDQEMPRVMANQAAKMSLDDLMAMEAHRKHAAAAAAAVAEDMQEDLKVAYDDKPIANLFPNTTVMFADICGFTAWSSERDPEQVFSLLENLFSAFDNIAKQRRVFKVETVGDCYIAVTGIPDPQSNHAVIMARFARDCNTKMNQIVSNLEEKFGPGTGDLGMRFGLNSGPVTAGVLRGKRARFQLYGDTVHIAARMESTGIKNLIQVSQETAQLLGEAGKSSWLKRREDTVNPLHDTFWLLAKHQLSSRCSRSSSSGQVDDRSDMGQGEQIMDLSVDNHETIVEKGNVLHARKLDRLVAWHVEVLIKYLKRIVAHRKALGKSNTTSKATLAQCERDILRESSIVDEVSEVIKFPKFNEIVSRRGGMDPTSNGIELKPAVVSQLREYVRLISTKYRTNAFHNFDHASHVVMSVEKLLSRILSYNDDDEENYQSLHDFTYGLTSDPLAQFAAVFCALVHDVDHRGVPNGHLVQTKDPMAISYHNHSVQEQNSMDIAWKLLMIGQFTDLRRCIYSTPTELYHFRYLLVNSIVATDLFDKDQLKFRHGKWKKAFLPTTATTTPTTTTMMTTTTSSSSSNMSRTLDTNTDGEQSLIHRKATVAMEYMLQASNVAHTMQHWHVFQKWNEKLFEEMTVAYKQGMIDQNPVKDWYENELSFFDTYVIPLAKKLSDGEIFGISSNEYLQYAMANREEWKKKGKQRVASMAEKFQI